MSANNLKLALALKVPPREEVLRRDYRVQKFWKENKDVLEAAWKEWDVSEKDKTHLNHESLMDTKLRESIEQVWQNPEQEPILKDLLQEVSLGVYQFQLFEPSQLRELRNYLEEIENAKIPLRPPYGIVLNRKGAMLDRRSEGYLAAPSFQSLYQEIFDKYMRPIARFLFPEITGYDTQTFGFSIQYKPQRDTSIRMHTDASSVTLNINLNLPEEEYTGSEVDFHDPSTGRLSRVKFKPGMAMLHKGNIPHAAHPITSGERTNLVLWLYGDRMELPRPQSHNLEIAPKERWTIPSNEPDDFAPF